MHAPTSTHKNRAGFCHSIISSEPGDKCGYVSMSYISLWPLYASFHLRYACLFLSFPLLPPPLLLLPCLSHSSCFSCLLNRDMLIWGPLCTATREQVSGVFWSAARSDMSSAPSCTLRCLIMQHNGQAQTTKRCTPTHVHSIDHTSMGTHIQKGTHTQSRGTVIRVLAALTVGWLVCWTQGSERERWCVWFPLSCPLLPLTVRWMIAITGAISETEWRSMGQGDTAMGNQPSDYCTALPWERSAVYLSCFFVLYASSFPSCWPFDAQNMKESASNTRRPRERGTEGERLRLTTEWAYCKSICLLKPVQMWQIS